MSMKEKKVAVRGGEWQDYVTGEGVGVQDAP